MNNLFSIFDPSNSILSLSWGSALLILMLFPNKYWSSPNKPQTLVAQALSFFKKEVEMSHGSMTTPLFSLIIVALFVFIWANNVMGLFPYIFTASSHPVFALPLALSLWVGYMIMIFFKATTHMLAHLVPLGTPGPLMPFMVLIESISNIIRPLTLSVRLTANMVAGHLIMSLVSGALMSSGLLVSLLGGGALILIFTLEAAVAMIQAYVFAVLMNLYISEANAWSAN